MSSDVPVRAGRCVSGRYSAKSIVPVRMRRECVSGTAAARVWIHCGQNDTGTCTPQEAIMDR